MKIEGVIEKVKGDFSRRKVPMVKCPKDKRKASISHCNPYCCDCAGMVYIDWTGGMCAVNCGYKESRDD